jgi:hypothetical protein
MMDGVVGFRAVVKGRRDVVLDRYVATVSP